MMNKLKKYISSIFLVFFIACGPMEPQDYLNWLRDYENGFHQLKTVGEYVFDVQYKPNEFMLLKEKEGGIPTKQELEAYEAKYSGEAYFDLKLGVKDSQVDLMRYKAVDQSAYQERVYYFSFKLQESIYLQQGEKKIPCSAYHFERAYNLKNNRSFILGFSGVDYTKPAKLVIHSGFLNTGPVKLQFNWEKLPKLVSSE